VAGLLVLLVLASGCRTGWVSCGPYVFEHTSSEDGVRYLAGRARVFYSYVEAYGGLWKVDEIEYTVIDYNQNADNPSFWDNASILGSLAGVVIGALLVPTGPGGWVLYGVSIASLAATTVAYPDGLHASNEDFRSASDIRVYAGSDEVYSKYTDGLSGNNGTYRDGSRAWKNYILRPNGVYVPAHSPSKVKVKFWGDSRGRDGDTKDHRDDANCYVSIPLPQLPR
jgi:hypothetical protein